MREPMLRVWMQDSVPPTTYYHERPGRWVGEPRWPSPNISPRHLALSWPATLEENAQAADDERTLSIRSPLSVGLFAGKWCSYAATPDLPHDQREEDGGALVFTGHPLDQTIELLGAAEVELLVSSDQPVSMVSVRLSDVAPDDKATRVTYGLLNLTHRESHERPTPLEPGQSYRVSVKLNDVAYAFPAGHRIRLSISTSSWPRA
jgi:putative CocE/NonD family hydrolase